MAEARKRVWMWRGGGERKERRVWSLEKCNGGKWGKSVEYNYGLI
jgi:hypothetical protein